MRGKQPRVIVNPLNVRITPACAGKTGDHLTKVTKGEDHPRVCGENFTGACGHRLRGGSPPRVRGKRISEVTLINLLRITPACAGKTAKRIFRDVKGKDHPRVCGENDNAGNLIRDCWGSPPRVRGKRRSSRRRSVSGQDHPRVCGENIRQVIKVSRVSGSPPRVRGKRGTTSGGGEPARITPACAGKTLHQRLS